MLWVKIVSMSKYYRQGVAQLEECLSRDLETRVQFPASAKHFHLYPSLDPSKKTLLQQWCRDLPPRVSGGEGGARECPVYEGGVVGDNPLCPSPDIYTMKRISGLG